MAQNKIVLRPRAKEILEKLSSPGKARVEEALAHLRYFTPDQIRDPNIKLELTSSAEPVYRFRVGPSLRISFTLHQEEQTVLILDIVGSERLQNMSRVPRALDRAKVMQWLDTRWKPDKPCPVCDHRQWAIANMLVETREYQGGNLDIGGSTIPFVSITCMHCGNTIFLNAVLMGLVKPEKSQSAMSPENQEGEQ